MKELEDFHQHIGQLFNKRKIPALSNEFKIEAIHRWSDRIYQSFSCDAHLISRTCSDIYWAFAEIQIAIGHCLWVVEKGKLTPGYNKVEGKAESLILSLEDIYFWYYIGCAWEMIYRSWERIASLLKLTLLEEEEKLYYNTVIQKIGNKYSEVSLLPTFRKLKDKIKKWNKVANRRNSITHSSSIAFSYMETEYHERQVVGPDGQPMYFNLTSFPNHKNELQRIVSYYEESGKLLMTVYDFLAECINHQVGTRSPLLP